MSNILGLHLIHSPTVVLAVSGLHTMTAYRVSSNNNSVPILDRVISLIRLTAGRYTSRTSGASAVNRQALQVIMVRPCLSP